MSKDIDHFIDNLILSIVLSIPIFFFAMSVWAQGFTLLTDTGLEKVYLQEDSYMAFLAQTGLMTFSLVFAIFSRMVERMGRKKHLLYLTIFLYILSLIAFGIIINSVRAL